MVSNGTPTLAELEVCRAKLICLIKDARKYSYAESKELSTCKAGLKAIDELIKTVRGNRAKAARFNSPGAKSA